MPGLSLDEFYSFPTDLQERLGPPFADLYRGIEAEHCYCSGSDNEFTSLDYHRITTTPKREFQLSTGKRSAERTELLDSNAHIIRTPHVVYQIMGDIEIQRAGLKLEEVLACILFTGPMRFKYTSVLRESTSQSPFNNMLESDNHYTSTIHCLCSAIIKMSRAQNIKPGTKLYRGMGNVSPPESFHASQQPGWTEVGMASITPVLDIALAYSGLGRRREASLLEITADTASRPGRLPQCCEQYHDPGEREFIYLPGTWIEPDTRAPRKYVYGDGNTCVVTVYPVRIKTCDLPLVEDIVGQRRKMHRGDVRFKLAMLRYRVRKHDVSGESAVVKVMQRLIKPLEELQVEHEGRNAEYYNNDEQYRVVVRELHEAYRACARALDLVSPQTRHEVPSNA
mmetsp:Transcript_13572/g.37552  ORF Transcript_13572/g.37552 Transcript_13572/m.37552 type:complete len:396 (+) Transcript_13572:278-1465(+)